MASKSKRRRKVLGASCILAALIIAGSSFAWFSSRDEVTNRLSANADYDVRIVESFAPPANWLPGQEVNKDVYATNTGNIGAFVREDVSGALTVTKEKATTAKTANSIKLTEEERYAVEAGAYLAYKPVGSAAVVGEQIVIRPGDKAGSTLTDFKPDTEGLYVFRRSIGVNADGTESFKYEGYYFVPGANPAIDPGDYYKISGLSIVADTTADKAGDNNKTDGNLAAASAGFWENETKVVDPVALSYVDWSDDTDTTIQTNTANAGVDFGKYLVAEYDTGNYKAEAALIAAADAYDQMIHNYEYLTALAEAAQAEATAAGAGSGGALATATTNLGTQQTALNNAKDALNTAQNNLNDAQVAYNDAVAANKYAKQQAYESKTKLFGSSGTTETDGTVTPNAYGTATAAGSLAKAKSDADAAVSGATYDMSATSGKTATDAFNDEVNDWFEANKTDTTSEAYNINEAYKTAHSGATPDAAAALVEIKKSVAAMEEFRDWIAAQTANENHDYYAKVAAQTIAQLNYDNEMIKLYGANNGGETGSSGTTPTAGSYTDASLWGKYQTADSDLNTATTGKKDLLGESTDAASATGSAWAKYNKAVEDLATAQAAYDSAYSAWADAAKASGIADDKLAEINAAKAAANAAKGEAKSAYESAAGAVGTSDGTLKVYIKLSDDVVTAGGTANKWQMLPTTVANDTASFYHTSILEGGETSAKLIDSVTLDKGATQDMYKYFDFDLNVALKSVQVTYADDNETILATATPEELDAIASLATATDIDTAITWSKTT